MKQNLSWRRNYWTTSDKNTLSILLFIYTLASVLYPRQFRRGRACVGMRMCAR